MDDGERRRGTQATRFEFMDWKLFWEGRLNRGDLQARFGISTPQSSVDIRDYRAGVEGAVDYDSTAKVFVPGRGFGTRFLSPSADRLLLQLRAWLTGALPRRDLWFRDIPSIDMAPDVARHVDADCLRVLLRAIRTRSAVEVEYQSLTNSRWRAIAPHALAFDGMRWHVRALACDRGDFRDFVLSRIAALGPMRPIAYDPADDVEWNTFAALILVPHPGLTPEQRAAVERDYSMEAGQRRLEVRLSMAFYFISRMNLDLPDLAPARAQIRLENLDEVRSAVERAKRGAGSSSPTVGAVGGSDPD